MPQSTKKLDFETLRDRLPKEIGDDIVRLISQSPEALKTLQLLQRTRCRSI